MAKTRIVPEFWKRSPPQRGAGFIPSNGDEDVELLQVWCKRAEDGSERRATTDDLRAAGFVKRKTMARRKP
jgi:hypothetical protein